MSNKILESNLKRTNFFDGQRISESDLDSDQIYFESLISEITLDMHSSGILKKRMGDYTLLDTSSPSKYSFGSSKNDTESLINSRNFDGRSIKLDRQPEDREYGSRLEIILKNSEARGRSLQVKVLIVGLVYDPQYQSGILNYEIITFDDNKSVLTENTYFNVKCIICNNLSKGTGKTDSGLTKESLNLGGDLIVNQVGPVKTFAKSNFTKNISSPNFDLANIFGSTSLSEEIQTGIGSTNSISELFINYSGDKVSFVPDSSSAISYGQKFVCNSNNIQKIELLMSVDRDSKKNLEWQGDLVFSLYELEGSDVTGSPNPIDGSPKISPITEVSLDQEDLKLKGFVLSEEYSKVEISFSSSKVADPKSGEIERGRGYAIVVSRRGNNSYGTINIRTGVTPIFAKRNSVANLSIQELYEPQKYEFVEFDPNISSYISDEEKSMWFVVHSAQVEITSGVVYGSNGMVFSIPKLDDYVAESKINFNLPPIDLANNNLKNIIGISKSNKFLNPDVHPRTGNYVYTRIKNYPQIEVFEEGDPNFKEENLVLVSTAKDFTSRYSDLIEISIDKPGILDRDFFYIINPSNSILSQNLVGRKFVPDSLVTAYEYIINKVERLNLKYGDFNNNKKYNYSDLNKILELSGNVINSLETERRILGGSIDILDFLRADINSDGIIDGTDIELEEQAISGNVNFPSGENLTVLKIYFETDVVSNDNPEIISSGPILTAEAVNSISFDTLSNEIALLIRPGDILEIVSGVNQGRYYVSSKTIEADGQTVELGLNNEFGDIATLSSEASNFIKIISSSKTNSLLDNLNLLKVPFSASASEIYFNDLFQSRNIEICDLRSFVECSFKEDKDESCLCDDEPDVCDAPKVNQKYLPGDLYLEGRVKGLDGEEYSGDYEFANISIDMPVGTIDGCQVDLYNSFIKSNGNTCLTKTGYNAMKFSDGTYVGCDDVGASTDISKNRVKITGAIASLHVDAFVDGYEVDGQSTTTETYLPSYKSIETANNYLYNIFGSSDPTKVWPDNASGNFVVSKYITAEAAEMFVETHNAASDTVAELFQPTEIPSLEGDFIYDFIVRRSVVQWEDYDLVNGYVKFYLDFTINNSDGSKSELKLGYKVYNNQNDNTKVFYSGEIFDSSGLSISNFYFEEDSPEVIGESLFFRLRRVNDTVFGYYYNPNYYDPDTNPTQEYVRIGQNLPVQPGVGSGSGKFVLLNSAGITTGKNFKIHIDKVDIKSLYDASSSGTSINLSRDFTTEEIERMLMTFPLPYRSTAKVETAKIKLSAFSNQTADLELKIIPVDNLDLDNIGQAYNFANKEDPPVSTLSSFISSVNNGDIIEINILPIIRHFQSNPGHIPGQNKGVYIEVNPAQSGAAGLKKLVVSEDIEIEYTYEDLTTGVVFQIGVDVNPENGIATFKTKNVLYDIGDKSKRTKVNFGVHLKKSGFKNEDLEIGVSELQRVKYGIGACIDSDIYEEEGTEDCFFISGDTMTGTFVQGPFPCNFYSGISKGISSSIELQLKYNSVSGLFEIDGISSPNLSFTEGVTYVFDVSDLSLNGIDFAFRDFSTTAEFLNGVSSTGTAGQGSPATVQITVPSGTNTLEYYDKSGTVSDTGTIFTQIPL